MNTHSGVSPSDRESARDETARTLRLDRWMRHRGRGADGAVPGLRRSRDILAIAASGRDSRSIALSDATTLADEVHPSWPPRNRHPPGSGSPACGKRPTRGLAPSTTRPALLKLRKGTSITNFAGPTPGASTDQLARPGYLRSFRVRLHRSYVSDFPDQLTLDARMLGTFHTRRRLRPSTRWLRALATATRQRYKCGSHRH